MTPDISTPESLRAGVVRGLDPGLFFVSRDEHGKLSGVPATLFDDLARTWSCEVVKRAYDNSGEITEALRQGDLDVSFLPVDEQRSKVLDFGPAYYVVESTYLVLGENGPTHIREVDRAGLRILGIEGTTTIRAAARTLRAIQPVAVKSIQDALIELREGRADGLALSRDALRPMLRDFPGSRIVDDAFQRTSISLAVVRGRDDLLRTLTGWLQSAINRGVVRRAFDELGYDDEEVVAAG